MQKEPISYTNGERRTLLIGTKSCFTSPSALGVVYRAVTTDRVVLVPVLGIQFGMSSLSGSKT